MCVSYDSSFFWIGLGLFIGLTLLSGLTLWRGWQSARAARSALEWAEFLMGFAPAIFVNGIWLFIFIQVTRTCWG